MCRVICCMFMDKDWAVAASGIVACLSGNVAPQKFWLGLFQDAIYLIENHNVIFGVKETYVLLECLETLGLANSVYSNDHHTQHHQHSAVTEEEPTYNMIDHMRHLLSQNLAKAILS